MQSFSRHAIRRQLFTKPVSLTLGYSKEISQQFVYDKHGNVSSEMSQSMVVLVSEVLKETEV